MNRRFSLDRASFEQFLAAASLLQQLRKQAALRESAAVSQPLVELLQLQQAIHSDTLELETAMQRIVTLAMRVAGANGAGIWLFDQQEFTLWAGVGNTSADERLRLGVLGKLLADTDNGQFVRKQSHYPGCAKSLLVVPIYICKNLAGGLGALSVDFDAFDQRDANNLRFLAGLIGRALEHAANSGNPQALALAQAAALDIARKLIPRVEELVREQESSSTASPVEAEPEPVSAQIYSLKQAQVADLPAEPEDEPDSQDSERQIRHQAASSLEDISVPGIGVRAALGDVREFTGENESASLSARVGQACRNAGAGVGQSISKLQGAIVRCAGLLGALFTLLAGMMAKVWRRRPNFSAAAVRVRFPKGRTFEFKYRMATLRNVALWRLSSFARWLSASAMPLFAVLAGGTKKVAARVRSSSSHRPSLPLPETRPLRRHLRQRQSDVFAAVEATRTRLRVFSRRQSRRVLSSGELAHEAVQKASRTFNQASADALSKAAHELTAAAGTVKQRTAAMSVYRLDRRALRRASGAAIVLVVMLAFAISLTISRDQLHTERVDAASPMAVAGPAAAAAGWVPTPAAVSTSSNSGPTSHLQITDTSAADTLHEMTRYEIATLRRAAEYGDDEAAFQLAMAYETGYEVRQSCSKAASWVQKAAEAGNPAAEYNLALRYRQGDGVHPDTAQAESWLSRAAAQKYSPAQISYSRPISPDQAAAAVQP